MNYNGGTVIAMAGKDCVTIGSDLRIGEQFLTVQTDKPKVHKVSDRVYVGLPGLATDARTVYVCFICLLYCNVRGCVEREQGLYSTGLEQIGLQE